MKLKCSHEDSPHECGARVYVGKYPNGEWVCAELVDAITHYYSTRGKPNTIREVNENP